MFKDLKIEKQEKAIRIFVKLESKILPKTPIVNFSWVDARALLQSKFPDLIIKEPLEKKRVLSNTSKHLEDSWIFPFVAKTKKEEIVEPIKEEPKKQTFSFSKKRKKVSKEETKEVKIPEQALTTAEDSAIVDETEQGDHPVIVQEPTE